MNNSKKSFILYLDNYEIFQTLDDESAGKLIKIIFQYAETKEEPKLEGFLKLAFIPMRQAIDRDYEKWTKTCESRSMAGSKGGLAKASKASKAKQSLAKASKAKQSLANLADTDNVTDTDNDNDTKYNIVVEIINYLNAASNKNFSTKTKINIEHINARIKEGHTFENFKTVIDKKCTEWLNDPGMNQYIRPQTLFGTKFESYLNANVEAKVETRAEAHKREVAERRAKELRDSYGQ